MKKTVITPGMKDDLVEKVTNGQLTVSQAALKYGVPEIFITKWVGDIEEPSAGTPADSPPSTSPSHTGTQDLAHLPPTEQPQHSTTSTASPAIARRLASFWWILLLVVPALWAFLGVEGMLSVLLWAILAGCLLSVVVKAYRLYKAVWPAGDGTPDNNRFQTARVDGMIASAALLLSIACWFLLPVVQSISTGPTGGATSGPGLTADELQLSSHTILGYWREDDSGLRGGDDEATWGGTAGVLRAKDGHLILISNSHCLNLMNLLVADESDPSLDAPEILEYELIVEFASGITRKVLQCGDQIGEMDLALLKVDATGLSEGRDYVLLPIGDTGQIKAGDEVVAVGSPLGLQGTQTYGRISAVRDPPHGENDVGFNHDRIFQTDAAINPGNSGGPLFVQGNSDNYKWIGVNTWGFDDADNLGFAIDAKSVIDSSYDWFDADAAGVSAHLKAMYNY